MVMLPFAYVMTQSLSEISFAKQRQTADGLLDQTMEQVRALRYSAIQAGLDTTDLTNNPDSNISASGGVYTFVPNGETIVTAAHSGAVPAPLNPHRSTISINSTSYTISTYPTYFQGGTTTYRVTVIVSWSPSQIHGVSNQVSSQTIVSSPSSGCLSDQTHPFAAPCQPFLYAQATSGNGFIQITPQAGTVGDAISGPNGNGSVPLSDANLFLVRDSSTMQIEQISKVQGAGQTSSAELNLDTSGTSSGGAIANAQADNDPATVSNQYSSVQPFQSATPL